MLDLTSRPQTSTLAIAAAGTAPAVAGSPGPTLAELRTHVAARTNLSASVKARYLSAIDEVGEILNRPLAAIAAELSLVEERFPLDGFNVAISRVQCVAILIASPDVFEGLCCTNRVTDRAPLSPDRLIPRLP